MHFLLSSMSVVYVLTTHIHEDRGDDATMEQIRKRAKWDNDDYVCRGLNLNGMSDSLFDIYQNVESSKELWDSLEAKYMAEDASSKKILISNFTNYKMTDSRPVLEQYNELLGILGRLTQHNMNMDDVIQVSCIIEKLSPSWKDFKHTLKHLKEKLALVKLGSHLRIEKSLRVQDRAKWQQCYVTYVFEAYFVQDVNVAWWVDLGATIHVCKDRFWFKTSFMSTSKLNDSILWHARLGHVHFKRMFCYVYLVHTKDEALDKFKVFKTKVELQQGSLIKRFRTDRGGLSQGFWGEAMEVVRLPDPKLKTLGEKGIECIFVGYAEHSKAFRFYVIESNDSILINSIIESRDAFFDENKFSSVPRPSLRIPNGTEDISGPVVPKEDTEVDDPKTFDEAIKYEDASFWKEVINDEIDSIIGNNTWVFADLPPGCKTLGFKWIFKRKMKIDGTIEKFKVRLVIQGFRQKSGIDYFDTYALVARISTIRLLISMESIHNLIIHQMDVKTTFLNGELDEEVDMTKEFLSSRFSMKDMEEADVILGINIKHESIGIEISQSYYTKKVLKKFNYFDCTPVSTLMDVSEKLMLNNGQAISQLEDSKVIGCLMYAITCTRPDIAFAMGKLSKYTSIPGTQPRQAIQRVLKYLKKTMDYNKLTYTGYPSVLEGAISWASKKQTCITGSIMESEFMALATAGKEAEWLRNLILEIPL
ncbi:zinc finger, CCHC-type containing protein [Tanacetum coccineum]|uniref:Zinc finger, CCHC-type containing protein n=1 Tax=Tanacetum coccineum TaxID=301880 RepID=A0ABQ5BM46_9ASTR